MAIPGCFRHMTRSLRDCVSKEEAEHNQVGLTDDGETLWKRELPQDLRL